MPFHLGSHKPVAQPRRASTLLKTRLELAAFGAISIALGLIRLSRGVLYIVNWHAMPIYSGALLATGALLELLAATPFSWIDRAVGKFVSRRSRRS